MLPCYNRKIQCCYCYQKVQYGKPEDWRLESIWQYVKRCPFFILLITYHTQHRNGSVTAHVRCFIYPPWTSTWNTLEDDNSQAALLRARGVLPASSEHGFFTKIWGLRDDCLYSAGPSTWASKLPGGALAFFSCKGKLCMMKAVYLYQVGW